MFVKVNVVRFLLSDVVASRYNSYIETPKKRHANKMNSLSFAYPKQVITFWESCCVKHFGAGRRMTKAGERATHHEN